MEIILFWVVAGGVSTAIGLRRGHKDVPSLLYHFFAWPLALTQGLWQAKSSDSLEAPEPQAKLAPVPPAVPAPPSRALLEDATADQAKAPEPSGPIVFTLDLPPAKDGQRPSESQRSWLTGRGLALDWTGLTFDQATFLQAALVYCEALFGQLTKEPKAPLPLLVETINKLVAEPKLTTYIRRWNAGRKANPPADETVVRLADNWQYRQIQAAMVASAPQVARRLEAAMARRPAPAGPLRFRVELAGDPAGDLGHFKGLAPKTVLATDLKHPFTILYENLDGEVKEHKIELLELYEEDGQLVLRANYGQVHALRNFRVERIGRLTDLKTGETAEDPEAYLRDKLITANGP